MGDYSQTGQEKKKQGNTSLRKGGNVSVETTTSQKVALGTRHIRHGLALDLM